MLAPPRTAAHGRDSRRIGLSSSAARDDCRLYPPAHAPVTTAHTTRPQGHPLAGWSGHGTGAGLALVSLEPLGNVVRKQEATVRAIRDAAARRVHQDRVRELSAAARVRYADVLERLGR
ncbi:hypothetical protein GCM10023168_05570 [Fodinibacter luteus]|uniref:Uncharacterized protein n=1 Tax=Fodinibacter luteus TaxID=552064 RepID=A0ABP8K0Y5_9MICO